MLTQALFNDRSEKMYNGFEVVGRLHGNMPFLPFNKPFREVNEVALYICGHLEHIRDSTIRKTASLFPDAPDGRWGRWH